MCGVLAVLLASSCAPSLRMVHRSRAYFERCYAADFNPEIRRTERHACWVAWLDHYTAAQPRERIMYAHARVAAQARDTDALALPGVDDPADAGVALAPIADAGQLADAEPIAADARPAHAAFAIPPPPEPAMPRRGSPACAPVCGPRFSACVALCNPENPEACRDACIAEHRACGNACL
jgi:hypothetical protein